MKKAQNKRCVVSGPLCNKKQNTSTARADFQKINWNHKQKHLTGCQNCSQDMIVKKLKKQKRWKRWKKWKNYHLILHIMFIFARLTNKNKHRLKFDSKCKTEHKTLHKRNQKKKKKKTTTKQNKTKVQINRLTKHKQTFNSK